MSLADLGILFVKRTAIPRFSIISEIIAEVYFPDPWNSVAAVVKREPDEFERL